MSWKVRHEGSPRAVEGLSMAQLVQGMQDGQWEPTDEVVGPGESRWVAIEAHPELADIAQDIEPPPRRHEEDESRLDMNALIDVCLVLLVFFILTTSYAALQKILDMPRVSQDKAGPPKITKEQVERLMIKVEARMQDKAPVVKVEGETVPLENLVPVLGRFRSQTNKTQILLDADADVPHGVTVAIQDAAAGARIGEVRMLVPPSELK